MGAELSPIAGPLVGLVKGPDQPGGIALPYGRRILLLDTYVAGTYYAGAEELEPCVTVGDVLVLRREPANRHDALAILVLTTGGRKAGYVPRDQNQAVARLMDAGKAMTAQLTVKEWDGGNLNLEMKVYLEDL